MPKNIVLCSDGTGNTAIKGRGTNVFKIFEAVELRANQADPAGERQIAVYDDGVGSGDFKPLKILGGGVGFGLSRNVRQLYRELARNYQPGDKIFLFGFSRGAFTVRVLAQLIAHVGIIDASRMASERELGERVDDAYSALRKCYRRFGKWRKPNPENDRPAIEFRNANSHSLERTRIEFIGVWDTVDAFGFPVDEIADLWHNVVYPYRFPDHDLSPIVQCARHAVSIDDERRTFHPELWNERGGADKRIQQVWFAGVHTNVGGGYPKQGMSLAPLVWMMQEAEARGLRFVPSMRQSYTQLQNVTDRLYDSRAGLAGYYGYKPRNISELCARAGAEPLLHVSAVERIALGTEGYAPGHIPENVRVVADRPETDTTRLSEIIRANFAANGSMLAGARKWIYFWRACQTMFAVASLAIVGLYLREYGWDGVSGLSSGSGYLRFGSFLGAQPALIAVLVVTYALCYLADSRLRGMYSRFWFGARKQLREVLFPEPAARAAGD